MPIATEHQIYCFFFLYCRRTNDEQKFVRKKRTKIQHILIFDFQYHFVDRIVDLEGGGDDECKIQGKSCFFFANVLSIFVMFRLD